MKYEKAKAELFSFAENAVFMVASAATIQKIKDALPSGAGFNETTGQISNCRTFGGSDKPSNGDKQTIAGVTFTWTAQGASGFWNCDGYR